MEPAPLLTHVGGQPVWAEYTLVRGTDATAVPEGVAVVRRADELASGRRLIAASRRTLRDLEAVSALDREARRAWVRCRAGGPDAERWRAEAESLEAARDAYGLDEKAVLRGAVGALKAEQDLAAIAGRPLIVLGDHPDLGDALDHALDAHPQVVHLPDA